MDEEANQIKTYQEYTKRHMNDDRYQHTLGVVEIAKDLAVMYNVDVYNATLAALFHDLAKELPETQKRELCDQYKIPIDDFLDKNIHLTHGAIAAYMVQEQFNITDSDIIKGIYNHTLGRNNMSDLEKIIYISDIIEPNRKPTEQLDKLRKLAYTNLNQAVKFALERNLAYLKAKNRQVHPIIYSIIEEYNH